MNVPTPMQAAFALAAWFATLTAAVVRRLPVGGRVALMVVAVWIYAGAMLDRGGVFMNFRLALFASPLMVIVLGGVRLGLVVGTINLLAVAGALWATEAGLLPREPPPWREGEWLFQMATLVGCVFPQLLLTGWLGHALATSMQRAHTLALQTNDQTPLPERSRLES